VQFVTMQTHGLLKLPAASNPAFQNSYNFNFLKKMPPCREWHPLSYTKAIVRGQCNIRRNPKN
jgi:hypothetical protein